MNIPIISFYLVDKQTFVSRQVDKLTSRQADESTSRRVDKQTSRQTDESTSRQVDKQTSRQADESTSRQVDKQTSRQTDESTSRQVDEQTSRQADEQTSRQADELTSRQADRQARGFPLVGSAGRQVQTLEANLLVRPSARQLVCFLADGNAKKQKQNYQTVAAGLRFG